MIDAGTAAKQDYAVGDSIAVQTRGPARRAEITGIASFGDVDSIGTATFALFELEAAQRLFGKPGRYDEILVAGGDDVRRTLAEALPQYQVQTAAAHDRFTLDGLDEFVSFIQVFLLAFGGIAVFVGAFTIYNTLSITVAQRSRELALHAGHRRHAAAGAARGGGRGARDRAGRVAGGRGRRARPGQAAVERPRVRRGRPAPGRDGVRHADASSCRCSSACS